MTTKPLKLVANWVGGFGISVTVIWAVTAVCHSNFVPKLWDPVVERNVLAPGWTYRNRYESWAPTHIGKHGIYGIADIAEEEGAKIIIWGDSFVEAFHLPDEDKMAQQLSGSWNARNPEPLCAAAVARSHWSVADAYVHMPAYERAVEDCRLHVVVLYRLEDTYPDRPSDLRVSLFKSEPRFHFERFDEEGGILEEPAVASGFETMLYRMNHQFFLRLRNRLSGFLTGDGLDFSLGPREPGKLRTLDLDYQEGTAPVEAWRFLLRSLKGRTKLPILFVYCPMVPTLDAGEVMIRDPEADLASVFAEECRHAGLAFVNLEEPFQRAWSEKGQFPRGFQTSRPWDGHFNRDGHRLVAEAIRNWLEAHRDVIHPD